MVTEGERFQVSGFGSQPAAPVHRVWAMSLSAMCMPRYPKRPMRANRCLRKKPGFESRLPTMFCSSDGRAILERDVSQVRLLPNWVVKTTLQKCRKTNPPDAGGGAQANARTPSPNARQRWPHARRERAVCERNQPAGRWRTAIPAPWPSQPAVTAVTAPFDLLKCEERGEQE